VAVGVPDGLGSRGGSDSEIVGSGKEIEGSGSEMATRLPVGLGSRGGNDSEIEGSGSRIGCGVAVGSKITGVLESYPSSPGYQIATSVLRGS